MSKISVVRNRNHEIKDEEKKYYTLLETYARILAPFYDAVFGVLSLGMGSRLRDKVVDFTNARKDSKILDVCTGTGKQAFAFAEKGFDVTGIDFSEDMLKVAKKNNTYENVRFEVADATSLPFEDSMFDISCVSFGLHDMIPSIREKALKEMVRLTKPKGTVIIIDYALPENEIGKFLVYNIVRLYEPYFTEFIRFDLEALLRRSGIEIEAKLPALFGAARIIKGLRADDADA